MYLVELFVIDELEEFWRGVELVGRPGENGQSDNFWVVLRIFPESSLRAKGLKIRSRAVVVPARGSSTALHRPRSGSFEPATCPGELSASFQACLHACRPAWK
eukprot:3770645-Pyramimonas_sp.AAC.1